MGTVEDDLAGTADDDYANSIDPTTKAVDVDAQWQTSPSDAPDVAGPASGEGDVPPMDRRDRLDMIRRIKTDDPASGIQIDPNTSDRFRRHALRYLRRLVLSDDMAAQLVSSIQGDVEHAVTIKSSKQKDAGGVEATSPVDATMPFQGSPSDLRMHERFRQLGRRTFENRSSSDLVFDQPLSKTEPAAEGVYRNRRPSAASSSWTASVRVRSTSSWLYHELTHVRNNQLGLNLTEVESKTSHFATTRTGKLQEERYAVEVENLYRQRIGLPFLRPVPQ